MSKCNTELYVKCVQNPQWANDRITELEAENAKWRAGELVTSDTAALEEAAQAVVDNIMDEFVEDRPTMMAVEALAAGLK